MIVIPGRNVRDFFAFMVAEPVSEPTYEVKGG